MLASLLSSQNTQVDIGCQIKTTRATGKEQWLQANSKATYISILEIEIPGTMLIDNILVYFQKLGIKAIIVLTNQALHHYSAALHVLATHYDNLIYLLISLVQISQLTETPKKYTEFPWGCLYSRALSTTLKETEYFQDNIPML